MTVSVVINYCNNEKMFIETNLRECSKFSDDIVVSYGSHLYNGTPEDKDYINYLSDKYTEITFVEYPVDILIDLTEQIGVIKRPRAYWHNLARWTGITNLKNNNNWVFIIDADEIPEGDEVRLWVDKIVPFLNENCAYKFANYWYFKEVTNQAKTLEDSVLLMNKKHLTMNNVFGDLERDYLILASKTKLMRQTKGLRDNVMWHHYSFVRSRQGLEHKLKNWAHMHDIMHGVNVDKVLDNVYKDNNVNDFIHNYQYNKVNNKFNIEIM